MSSPASAAWPGHGRSWSTAGRSRLTPSWSPPARRPACRPARFRTGERILTWRQLYDLEELPAELIVVGSGVTGAEFASAYQALGSQVTLISSRERMLPHEDADAAMVVEGVSAAVA